MSLDNTARLLITCPDRPGIVAAVSGFLFEHGANITALDQHSTDPEGGRFFMRLEFQTPNLDLSRDALLNSFATAVAGRFEMDWRISFAADRKRMALMVSKEDHALMELLWRWSRDEIPVEVCGVISNHPDNGDAVRGFGVPFHVVPVTPETRESAEAEALRLIGDDVDFIVLARYMQILTSGFVARFPESIINIHHSFLPAFAGANPYQQAWSRGVKIIGATAHYVTDELDEGPIIEQDIVRVSHRQSAPDMRFLGRDLERQVLARAVRWHVEDRIIVDGNKTIVFN